MTDHPSPPQELSFKSGLPGLDAMLQGLRPGDNVVLKVGTIEDYRLFVEPFARECLAAKIPFVYFRFAHHPPLFPPSPEIAMHQLDPGIGFERFIAAILDIIEEKGRGACYVFDSLSGLAVDWYSERMLGNFFMLACPYLYQLDTVAYFALIRDRHSPLAVNAITNTAQVVLDIYQNQGHLFVHPLKVDHRFSQNMYQLHRRDRASGDFIPVRGSATMSAILGDKASTWLEFTSQRPDVWTELFLAAKQAVADDQDEVATRELHERLLRMAITRHEQFFEMARQNLPLPTLLTVIKRMVGTGLIGGKSLGMLLSRAILTKNNPDWAERLEAHDSFFIGSDVFYTFLVLNHCWWPRRRNRDEPLPSYLERAEEVRHLIAAGTFRDDIMEQFTEMLNYFGQSPIIVRSSSLQEDNYGNAFSGKYDSVFCANQGTPQQRMTDFLDAVRTVYASTMSREALLYRHERGLLEQDEQMALLVQRVSGASGENCFFPALAGVGFSYNPYVWGAGVKPEAGMLRLVFGLGTRAVDRTDDDYTRLVALNDPALQPAGHAEDSGRYCQRRVDVIDLRENRFATVPVDRAVAELPPEIKQLLTSLDRQMVRRAREHGVNIEAARILDFDEILQTALARDFRDVLKTLQTAYGNPVDIEFTVNFIETGQYLINLVQCRPFQVAMDAGGKLARPPESLPSEQLILRSAGPIIGHGLAARIDEIIYILPAAYSRLSEQDRYSVARLIGRLTHRPEAQNKMIMLIGPGRWGTSSPSLGVPVSFSEINTVKVLCEMAVMHEGLIPDISLGTHFFNDLVEINMLYLAVFPEKENNLVNEKIILQQPNLLEEKEPADQKWREVVRVIRPSSPSSLLIHADSARQKAVCWQEKSESH